MKGDKKKMMVLGALLVVILGVGAFQLVGGGGSKPPETKTKKSTEVASRSGSSLTVRTATGAPTTGSPNASTGATKPGDPNAVVDPKLVAMSALPVRDPFDGSKFQPAPPPKAKETTPKATTDSHPRSSGPRPLGGKMPPFPVGSDGNIGLPSAGAGQTGVSPGAPLKDPNAFNYSVSGVITGDKPAAVFTDEKGNQQLVSVGGSVGGDSQVVAISRGHVTVRHRGKNMTFTVGGAPNEKN